MTTMTPEERTIMQSHVGYWSGKVASGNALVFGPVADPGGGYGIGIMRARRSGRDGWLCEMRTRRSCRVPGFATKSLQCPE